MSDDYTRYVILLEMTHPERASRELFRRHVAFLEGLEERGSLVLAGPFADHSGGMVILKASSLDDARAIAQRDPLVAEGVESFEVKTWELSCKENNHMGLGSTS